MDISAGTKSLLKAHSSNRIVIYSLAETASESQKTDKVE